MTTREQLLQEISKAVQESVEKQKHRKHGAIFHCPYEYPVLHAVRELAEFEYKKLQEEMK